MSTPPTLEDKTALVTGSTSGVGHGIARALAEAGCHVVLNGFGDAAAIAAQRSELAALHGKEIIHHGADLTRPGEIADLLASAARINGATDILVNNAGAQFVSPIDTFPPEQWDNLLALNLSAAFHTTRGVLVGMRGRGWGRIVNIASAHGLVASPFKSAYVAAKHGLVGFTKVTALETARDGITCNAVRPGYIHTPLVEKQIDEQARVTGVPRARVIDDVILAKQPNKAFVTVEQVAALAVFLCSGAGASVTGAALSMDGAWTAQ